MDWFPILIVAHLVGTVLGVGGATFAEINILRALSDGKVSPDESNLMHGVYSTIRLGFFITLISGFGFLVFYRLNGMEELLFAPKLWAKMTIIGFLGLNAMLLQLRVIPLLWGSAISITSWYAALIIGSLKNIEYSYLTIMAIYAVAVTIAFAILMRIHNAMIKKHK